MGGPSVTRYGPPVSPLLLLVIGLVSFVSGLYTWDRLTLTCQRLERGHITCQRTFYVWLGRVKDMEQSYEDIQGATQLTSDQVLLQMVTGNSEFLDGFGPDTANQLNQFIDSPESTRLIERDEWPFVSLILFFTSLSAWSLAGLSFWGRSGGEQRMGGR